MNNETLIRAARAARSRAYAPYSKFLVGAALLTEDGTLFTGANIENASYGMTVCAERTAVWNAIHAGHRKFKSIAVAADCSPPPSPCGACRQVLWELAGNIDVIMGNLADETEKMTLLELLAKPFGTENWAENPVSRELEASEDLWRIPVSFHPVGYVVNDYNVPQTIPDNYKELLSKIIIDADMEEGLYRLDEEKNIIVISHLHKAAGYTLKDKRSGRGNEVYGVFACRAPLRPNAIAQSVVELVDIDRNILTVKGLDLINGTPVLDIKTDYRNK
ncbi:MAG: cytidine deaminase [Dethiobacteria bacterium]